MIPPRLGYCASCVETHDDLALGASERGRLVWLCPDCRSDLGKLRQYAGWHPNGTLTSAGFNIAQSKRSRKWAIAYAREQAVIAEALAEVGIS